MMKRMVWLAAMVLPLGGCCIISCNGKLPNSFVKVSSATEADCTYEDKLGLRAFKAPGQVLGMPSNAPGKLTCQAKGYKPYSRTLTAQDWNPLTPLSGDPDALRYFSEVEMTMEAGDAETGK
jgi:hypothetical protein